METACGRRRAVPAQLIRAERLVFPKAMRNCPFKRDYAWKIKEGSGNYALNLHGTGKAMGWLPCLLTNFLLSYNLYVR